MNTQEILEAARGGRAAIAVLSGEVRSRALNRMAACLSSAAEEILAANAEDLKEHGPKMTEVMQDRLRL